MKIILNCDNVLRIFSTLFAKVTQSMVCPNVDCESENVKTFVTGDGNPGTLETIQNTLVLSKATTPGIV